MELGGGKCRMNFDFWMAKIKNNQSKKKQIKIVGSDPNQSI